MNDVEQPRYLDAKAIDWNTLQSATFEVRQWLRYEYPGPIEDVHQVLVLVPPDEAAGQRLLSHDVMVFPRAQPRYSIDSFGNRLCHIALPSVNRLLEFTVLFQVRRWPADGHPMAGPGETRLYLLPSPLTEPDSPLRAAAEALGHGESGSLALAARLNAWVHQQLTYRTGATDVFTTASDALALGVGVCQDYAHILIALCRILSLPARYISGHLIGEGAMHAWVEVLLARDGDDGRADAEPLWYAFDPTHGRRTGMQYITIAAGRDYGDVSPTRGSFRAPYAGYLSDSNKLARVLATA